MHIISSNEMNARAFVRLPMYLYIDSTCETKLKSPIFLFDFVEQSKNKKKNELHSLSCGEPVAVAV